MKLRILQIIPSLSSGGAERLVVDLVNSLVDSCTVKLVLFYSTDLVPNQIFLNDLDDRVSVEILNKNLGFNLTTFIKLNRIIFRFKPHIIHSHLYTFKYIVPNVLFNRHLKSVHTIHSEANREATNGFDRYLKQFMFRCKLSTAVVISKENLISFKLLYGNVDFSLIENGRSLPKKSDNFNSALKFINSILLDEKTKIFLFIGRLEMVKNPKLLLESFALFFDDAPNAKLIIIGRDTKYMSLNMIHEFLDKHKLKDKIFFIGEKTNVFDYLYNSDYLCITSSKEGMPISLIEAMSLGVIPITTKVGAIPGMIGDFGYISESNSVDDYQYQLKKAYKAEDDSNCIKRKALIETYNHRFNIDICAKNYINLYNKLKD